MLFGETTARRTFLHVQVIEAGVAGEHEIFDWDGEALVGWWKFQREL